MSDPAAVDPEEALIAALAGCHMLWFLSIAAERGYRVDQYRDQAAGTLARNADGKWYISVVTLHPCTQFSGESLRTEEQIIAMHHAAHAECYITRSVTAQMRCEPVFAPVPPAA